MRLTGLSDANGSWKIIWTCERYASSVLRRHWSLTSLPSKMILPSVGS